MTAADGRAHTTDGDRAAAFAIMGLPLDQRTFYGYDLERIHAITALAAERRRAAEDGQRLRGRVEALAAELEGEAEEYATYVERLPTAVERASATARAISNAGIAGRLRAALRDDTEAQP